MGKYGSIFRRLRLNTRQLRTVAERRLDDARYLAASEQNARANGAIYLAGFVIECLLKATLLDRHPNVVAASDPARMSKSDQRVLRLLYSHDLDDMMDLLPELHAKLDRVRPGLWRDVKSICEEWTVYARYSPKQATNRQAREFLDIVDEVKTWLA